MNQNPISNNNFSGIVKNILKKSWVPCLFFSVSYSVIFTQIVTIPRTSNSLYNTPSLILEFFLTFVILTIIPLSTYFSLNDRRIVSTNFLKTYLTRIPKLILSLLVLALVLFALGPILSFLLTAIEIASSLQGSGYIAVKLLLSIIYVFIILHLLIFSLLTFCKVIIDSVHFGRASIFALDSMKSKYIKIIIYSLIITIVSISINYIILFLLGPDASYINELKNINNITNIELLKHKISVIILHAINFTVNSILFVSIYFYAESFKQEKYL